MSDTQSLIDARYGRQSAKAEATQPENPVLTTILSHASVRHFSDQDITDDILNVLISAAQSAPTSSNLQPWSVVAIQNAGKRQRIAALSANQAFVAKAPLFLIWLVDLHRLSHIVDASDLQLDSAKELTGVDYVDTFLVGVTDATIAAQNTVLAARSLGLGSVYVGAIRNHLDKIIAELKLPPQVFPLFGLALGYPDPAHQAAIKPRLASSVVLHREEYREDAFSEQALQQYEQALNIFQANNGQLVELWRDKVKQRLNVLNGRENLTTILQQRDFPLL